MVVVCPSLSVCHRCVVAKRCEIGFRLGALEMQDRKMQDWKMTDLKMVSYCFEDIGLLLELRYQ